MSYNPEKDKPGTIEQYNILIDYMTNKAKAAYETACEEARTQAEAAYQTLPDDDNRLTLEQFIAEAVRSVPQPMTRAEFEQMYSCYYPKEEPVFVEPAPTPEQKLALERSQIDAETSAKILAGFDYEVNGEVLHFHYDRDDQLNFESGATGCLMKKAGAPGLPETAPVNAYRPDGSLVRLELSSDEYLALYGAALAHKAACLEAGGQKKAALA